MNEVPETYRQMKTKHTCYVERKDATSLKVFSGFYADMQIKQEL